MLAIWILNLVQIIWCGSKQNQYTLLGHPFEYHNLLMVSYALVIKCTLIVLLLFSGETFCAHIFFTLIFIYIVLNVDLQLLLHLRWSMDTGLKSNKSTIVN